LVKLKDCLVEVIRKDKKSLEYKKLDKLIPKLPNSITNFFTKIAPSSEKINVCPLFLIEI